jgi:ubiquinone/menaquinone biosynthesis C-methylase UbiE
LVERAIKHAIDDRHAANGSAHIVDIATGAGRYLLDTLKRCTSLQLTAELRDAEASNLDAGRAIARSLELTNVIFTRADAFDRSALEHIDPIPDVAIVSGLYELFPDNRRVLNSLEGLARAIPEGGLLIYTNQPWHPQLELIARGLSNWDGEPWIMRRRTQAEMDELVGAAGFAKVQMEIDPWGMFTVSIARRIS